MSGYVVAARVTAGGPRWAGPPPPAAPDDRADSIGAEAGPELLRPADDPLLGERWEAFRERWSQLTFFLFDGESWRR